MSTAPERSELFIMADTIIDQLNDDNLRPTSPLAKWLTVVKYGNKHNKGHVHPDHVASEFLNSLSTSMFRDNPTLDLVTMVEFIDCYKRSLGQSKELADTLSGAATRLGQHNTYTEFTALVFVLVFTEVVKQIFAKQAPVPTQV